MHSFARLETVLNWSAVVVLLVGLGSSLLIWHIQDMREAAGAGNPDDLVPTLDSRKYAREVEYYNGKAGMMLEEAKGLLHGKPLAKTIAVVSVITAVGLFLVAVRWPD